MKAKRLLIRGIKTYVELHGNCQLPSIVLLHGFTGSTSTWQETIHALASDYYVVAVDLIGHGQTEAPLEPQRYHMEEQLADLREVLMRLSIVRPLLCGYSMGGRVALAYATTYPDEVAGVVLESSSPGLRSMEERCQRRQADAQLAEWMERDGIEKFVDFWQAIPLFHSQRKVSDERRLALRQERLSQQVSGLANSLRGIGTGSQPSYWGMLDQLTCPVLLVTGSEDPKFVEIAREMMKYLPNVKHQTINEAGHAIHVEKPRQFATMIKSYLKAINEEELGMTRQWESLRTYDDIKYEMYNGIAKITINRPEVRNAFRPKTVMELIDAFSRARDDSRIGVIVLTGEGEKAFCSGGDQSVRGHGGYVGEDEIPRLNVLDLQRLIRVIPKPVVAMVAGYAIGGGHVLHVVCDLTIAADNARFGQTGPTVGSFDAGYGSGYLARIVGHKKAREIWYLCRQYDAQEALEMGLVNTVVPYEQLEDETVQWCSEMLSKSPTALRFLKAAMNADTDGLAGLQQLAGDATLLYYTTDEAKEGRDAFKEKRTPDFDQFPRFP